MVSMALMLGAAGIVFALSALAKIQKLEQRLTDAGVLKDTSESG